MLINQIKKLIRLVEESKIDELEVSRWGSRIRIRKNPGSTNSASTQPGDQTVQGYMTNRTIEVSAGGSAANTGGVPDESAVASTKDIIVTSPMVGTFYRSPTPEAPPFVDVGSRVSVGQTLCIIEAMKLMNELPSEINGIINRILVENGEPIEYGQELFHIAP